MNLRRFCNFIFIFALLVVCTTPIAHALDFTPMAGIPGLTNNGGTYTLAGFINKLYIFLITAGAVIGVVKIAFAGVKYATSDIGGSKSAAKEDIKGVLLGLAILTLPYLVLSAINPKFTSLDVLNLKPLGLEGGNLFDGSFVTSSDSSNDSDQLPVPEGNAKTCGGCYAPSNDKGHCVPYIEECLAVKGTSTPVPSKDGKGTSFFCVVPSQSTQCPKGVPDPASNYTVTCSQTCIQNLSANGNPAEEKKCLSFDESCEKVPGVSTSTSNDYMGGVTITHKCLVTPGSETKCPVPPGS